MDCLPTAAGKALSPNTFALAGHTKEETIMLSVRDHVGGAVTGYGQALASDRLDYDHAGYRLLGHITFTLLLVAVAFAAIALCL